MAKSGAGVCLFGLLVAVCVGGSCAVYNLPPPADLFYVNCNIQPCVWATTGQLTDVNGDGLIDIVKSYDDDSHGSVSVRNVWLNTGDGWVAPNEFDATWDKVKTTIAVSCKDAVRRFRFHKAESESSVRAAIAGAFGAQDTDPLTLTTSDGFIVPISAALTPGNYTLEVPVPVSKD